MSARLHRWYLAFLALSAVLPAASVQAASLSCSASFAGSCEPLNGKLSVVGEFTSAGSASTLSVTTAANAETGSLSAYVALGDGIDPGGPPPRIEQAGANMFAEFDIQGPAGGAAVALQGMFNVSGTITTNCGSFLACNAAFSFSANVQGADLAVGTKLPGFNATFGASRSTGSPALFTQWSGQLPDDTFIDTGTPDAALAAFTAMVRPGYRIKVDLSLSATAQFGNNAPVNAVAIADAGQTALFNFLLPEGYSLAAVPGFLSDPILQPVPIPGVAWLMAGVLVVGGRALRRQAS